MLLGEAQATIDVANDTVRRMSGSRREREAQPSSELVHHIIKAEVSALKDEVNNRMDALNERLGALEAKVETKLDTIANSIFEITRELKARGRP